MEKKEFFQKQQKLIGEALAGAGKIDSRLSLWRSLAPFGRRVCMGKSWRPC